MLLFYLNVSLYTANRSQFISSIFLLKWTIIMVFLCLVTVLIISKMFTVKNVCKYILLLGKWPYWYYLFLIKWLLILSPFNTTRVSIQSYNFILSNIRVSMYHVRSLYLEQCLKIICYKTFWTMISFYCLIDKTCF